MRDVDIVVNHISSSDLAMRTTMGSGRSKTGSRWLAVSIMRVLTPAGIPALSQGTAGEDRRLVAG